MSDHLKKIAGNKSEMLLYKLTDKSTKGVLIGTVVTALLQSSSAVSAMTLSLIDSNLLKLEQGIGIILGSILGTSVTGWLIAYSSVEFSGSIGQFYSTSFISAFFAIIGIILKLFIKKKKLKRFGEILLGFSILMLGIHTITQALAPIKNNTDFIQQIQQTDNTFIMFLAAIGITALFQSASAATGIVQTLSLNGIIEGFSAMALLGGIGIGASVPVLIAAVGKCRQAKRASLIYLFINCFGAIIIGLIFLITGMYSSKIMNQPVNAISIAAMNTAYRFITVVLSVPLIRFFKSLSQKCIPERKILRK